MSRDRTSPFEPSVEVVTEAAHLEAICAQLRQAGRFAFDTEFIKEDRFEPVVCLIQVATEDRVALVDPLADKLDITPLWRLLADPDVDVIVHAGAEDLGLCYRYAGALPARLFDVQIAAGLVGHDYPLSLARLVRGVLGVRLHKSQTLSDWQLRPLSPTQQRYAVEDVAYLPAIARMLEERLAKLSRREWATEEFARLARAAEHQTDDAATLARIKGSGSLDARGLAIMRELIAERNSLAERLNRPPRGVLKDHLLVEIARRGWNRPQDIRSLRGISLNDRSIRQLVDAVQKGLALPPDQCPVPDELVEETPEESVVIALATAVLRGWCLQHHLAYPLLTNKQDIRSAVLAHVRGESPSQIPPLMTGWRCQVLGPLLDRVLSGSCAVRLKPAEGCPTLKIE
jgi:ribonuclease D